MRIISQDGLCDYPYEHCWLFVNNKERTKLCITVCGDGDSYGDLAKYASEEDAKFALQYFSAMYLAGIEVCEALSTETMSELRKVFLSSRENGENVAQFIKRKAVLLK